MNRYNFMVHCFAKSIYDEKKFPTMVPWSEKISVLGKHETHGREVARRFLKDSLRNNDMYLETILTIEEYNVG